MIDPKMIPPEAVEAAARADYELTRDEALADHGIIASVTYCPWEELSDDGKEYYMTHARAAILAALEAWNPSWTETECDNAGDIVSRVYVLDITPEENADAET